MVWSCETQQRTASSFGAACGCESHDAEQLITCSLLKIAIEAGPKPACLWLSHLSEGQELS